MCDFMRDHVIEHLRRSKNEAPGKRQAPRRRAGTPAARGVANGDAFGLNAELAGIFGDALVDLEARFAFQPVDETPRHVLGAAFNANCRARCFAVDPDRRASPPAPPDRAIGAAPPLGPSGPGRIARPRPWPRPGGSSFCLFRLHGTAY